MSGEMLKGDKLARKPRLVILPREFSVVDIDASAPKRRNAGRCAVILHGDQFA
jgi:hypothetical protein